jgi:hypothetical protein
MDPMCKQTPEKSKTHTLGLMSECDMISISLVFMVQGFGRAQSGETMTNIKHGFRLQAFVCKAA